MQTAACQHRYGGKFPNSTTVLSPNTFTSCAAVQKSQKEKVRAGALPKGRASLQWNLVTLTPVALTGSTALITLTILTIPYSFTTVTTNTITASLSTFTAQPPPPPKLRSPHSSPTSSCSHHQHLVQRQLLLSKNHQKIHQHLQNLNQSFL
jgi:hypothetical protein